MRNSWRDRRVGRDPVADSFAACGDRRVAASELEWVALVVNALAVRCRRRAPKTIARVIVIRRFARSVRRGTMAVACVRLCQARMPVGSMAGPSSPTRSARSTWRGTKGLCRFKSRWRMETPKPVPVSEGKRVPLASLPRHERRAIVGAIRRAKRQAARAKARKAKRREAHG